MKDQVSYKHVCEEDLPLNNNIEKQIGDFVDMPSEAVEQGMDANVPDEIAGAKGEQVLNHVVKKGNLEYLVCKEVTNPGVNELVDKGRPLKRKRPLKKFSFREELENELTSREELVVLQVEFADMEAGSESRPPMLNKENYVPWSSHLLRYAKSKTNGKLIHNSILNGPYVKKMIPEPGDANCEITVTETFHLQTDELSDKELKQIEADDQAIQTILLGLPEDIYAAVDSCKNAQKIWLRVQQMMKGSDIGIQKKKAKLFNEWERFTSNEEESIESYYHHFLKLMNDLKRNKHFPEKIARNIKYLNNLQPEWSRHRISSNPRNRQIAQPGINIGQDRQMQMVRGNGGNQFRQYAGQNVGNHAGCNDVIGNQAIQNAVQNPRIGNGNLVATRAKGNAAGQNGNQIRCYNCRGVEEYDLMAVAADLDEIEEVNANCILMANLQQASTSGTQTDSAPVYDSDGSTENDNDVISEDTSVEQGGETVEQHPTNFKETRALYDSLYQNLATEVEKVNSVNRKLKETNVDLTTKLARFKNQTRSKSIAATWLEKVVTPLIEPGIKGFAAASAVLKPERLKVDR
nr:hypothetical protein [Tanacetum cinerariifolium]